ncbi:AraC family transcriptional regulator [Fundicoccus culcitae]|uniref:AraC family transcriptional regulator n=1 Tax=Fundicoccus culcitae TaxID=2969821 RepID=A0ABY5P746_9LACT|nr:AraC family transcriptional regulator [Fundicoccus culcitae]UUX34411.1 AraC family transcriptional regulator [Fundicoccus culcitae]
MFHRGQCRFLVGTQIYYLHPGDILLIDGMTVHRAYVVGDENQYLRSVIHFDQNWIKPLLKALNIDDLLRFFSENRNGLIRTFSQEDQAMIESHVLKLEQLNQLDNSYKNEAKRQLAFIQLLLTINDSTIQILAKNQTQQDHKIQLVEEATAFIFKHFKSNFSIEDITKALNVSKSHLSQTFKEVTGYTIMHYTMGFRLSQARNVLMVNHTKSIKDIAYENGFESDAHFSRFFKKFVGVTPSQFRKKHKNIIKGDF